jgi:hypothetical protein
MSSSATLRWLFRTHGQKRLQSQPWTGVIRVLPYFIGIAAILPASLAAASIFRLRIDADEIVQMVGPWVASRRRFDQVAGMSIDGKLFPITVRFRDGGRFRLLALHLADRARLVAVLSERVPGIEGL